MNNFDAKNTKTEIVKWIQEWFKENGNGCNCVIGISGGKDSSVVAALCCEALGKDKVIGVLMPNGIQSDINDAYALCKHLDIKHIRIQISDTIKSVMTGLDEMFIIENGMEFGVHYGDNTFLRHLSEQTKVNIPPRIRMCYLYAVAQSINGRVANTCNLSEDWIGFSTRYGDTAGDFSPLSKLTATEVVLIGKELNLPKSLIEKEPSDGLTGKTDEESFGFTYDVLDKYIRTGIIDDHQTKEKIDYLHKKNKFKLELIPAFNYNEEKNE